jgi:hypothetical protein
MAFNVRTSEPKRLLVESTRFRKRAWVKPRSFVRRAW